MLSNAIKHLEDCESTEVVLEQLKFYQEILDGERLKAIMGFRSDYLAFEHLENIGYSIAISKVKTNDDADYCISEIEQNYSGPVNMDQWMIEIRTQVLKYGIIILDI